MLLIPSLGFLWPAGHKQQILAVFWFSDPICIMSPRKLALEAFQCPLEGL